MDRTKGIGGSDIAAIMGLSPWKSPLDVWYEKTGRDEPEPDNDAMYWGRTLEAVVAQEYEKRTGNKVRKRAEPYRHADYPFLLGHVDRLIEHGGILECKTTDKMMAPHWGEPGTDEVPAYYLTQVLHYIGLSGRGVCEIPVLFGGRKYEIYHVEKDKDVIDGLWQESVKFWENYVLTDEPPEPRTEEEVKRLYPQHKDEEKLADAELAQMIEELKAVQSDRKAKEKREKELRDNLLPHFGDAAALVDPTGKPLATYKASKPSVKIDYKKAATDQLDESVLEQYKQERPGSRRLLIK